MKKLLNKFRFINKIKGEDLSIFDEVFYYSSTTFSYKRAIILLKLKHNYFVIFK